MTQAVVAKPKSKPLKCQSCGICIDLNFLNPNFIEHYVYKVGDFTICGWCRGELAKYGHIELARTHRGNIQTVKWLYPDGTVEIKQVEILHF